MHSILIFGIVTISTILWLKYLDHLDYYKTDKRTTRIVYIGLAAGMISIVPTFILYDIHRFLFAYFITGPFRYNFLIAGLSEELAKYLMLVAVVISFRSIKEPQDGIIQGAAVGASFAAIENIKYGFTYGPGNVLIRSFLCTGGHMLYTALAGYFLAAAIYSNIEVRDRRSVRLALFAFIPTAFIYGLYNASFDWEYLYEDVYSNLTGPAYLVDAVTLLITVRVFLSLIEHSPYFLFPCSRHRQAIRAILKGLKLRIGNILNSRVFRHNHYFDRIKKYGKKHYWKSDNRLLREKLEELSELLQKQKSPEGAFATASVSSPLSSPFNSHG